MQAIGREESLIDPTQLFKTDSATNQLDAEDLLYWNVELPVASEASLIPETLETQPDLFTVTIARSQPTEKPNAIGKLAPTWATFHSYFKTVTILPDEKFARVEVRLQQVLECGLPDPNNAQQMLVEGLKARQFAQDPQHEDNLLRWLTKYLRSEKAVLREYTEQVADEMLRLGKQIFLKPEPKLHVLPKPKVVRRSKPDLMAVPDDIPTLPAAKSRTSRVKSLAEDDMPQQLALF